MNREAQHNLDAATPIDDLMQQATDALTATHYLRGEALCVRALAQAREANRWTEYARILLPLQECRRQRRLAAAEGVIRLGTAHGPADITGMLTGVGSAGCMVVTAPVALETAVLLQQAARETARHVEVLYARPGGAQQWRVAAVAGVETECAVTAPPERLRDRWLAPGEVDSSSHRQAAAWFLAVGEALGDAILAGIGSGLSLIERIAALEAGLAAVTDHELLHQRLFEAAMALAGPRAADTSI